MILLFGFLVALFFWKRQKTVFNWVSLIHEDCRQVYWFPGDKHLCIVEKIREGYWAKVYDKRHAFYTFLCDLEEFPHLVVLPSGYVVRYNALKLVVQGPNYYQQYHKPERIVQLCASGDYEVRFITKEGYAKWDIFRPWPCFWISHHTLPAYTVISLKKDLIYAKTETGGVWIHDNTRFPIPSHCGVSELIHDKVVFRTKKKLAVFCPSTQKIRWEEPGTFLSLAALKPPLFVGIGVNAIYVFNIETGLQKTYGLSRKLKAVAGFHLTPDDQYLLHAIDSRNAPFTSWGLVSKLY